MTSTERLRALLDERGVEYEDRDMCGKHVFHWGEPLHGAMFTDGGEWTELVVENASPEQAIAATVGRSCASCPEMDDPDSYISHLQAALKWHDEHVPRPTNPRNTCVVLEGKKPPEEVMFIRDAGGVTHYLPEETCHMRLAYEEEDADGCIWPDHYECDACGAKVNGIMPFCDTEIPPKFCPNCGRRVVSE